MRGPVQHVKTVADFLPNAESLRATYDENFRNPREVKEERFCWDYWHVPDQYTQLRTPAQDYFKQEDYEELEASLLEYGKEKLGCLGITPIWLSYYVGTYAVPPKRPLPQQRDWRMTAAACMQTAAGRSCTATTCMGRGRSC